MILYSPSHERDPFGLFDTVIEVNRPSEIKQDGCLILWGGEDIWPGIYNQQPNKQVYARTLSRRDQFEILLINHCIKHNIPMIGICRGAQLLCAMSGGSLAQHIEDHGFKHYITLHDEGNVRIPCNSSHHQMMLPPASAKILATADKTLGINQYNQQVEHEQVNEVVWFPTILALGIQPHPEWPNSPEQFNSYCQRKIKEYILCLNH